MSVLRTDRLRGNVTNATQADTGAATSVAAMRAADMASASGARPSRSSEVTRASES